MPASPSTSRTKHTPRLHLLLLLLALAAAAACKEEPVPGVCCTTDADCARLGGISPRGCPDGFACRDLRCEAADCASAADCTADRPACDPDRATCAGCTASADCAGYADAPVCDPATGGCRACALDAECASEVCDVDTGRCADERDVIYASPAGSDTAGCTHAQPCSVARALVVAAADPSPSLVRLLPGTYGAPVTVTSGVVEIVGAGVTLMAQYALESRESAVVEARGLEIVGSAVSMSTSSLFPSLTLRDSVVRVGAVYAVHGILRMVRSSTAQVSVQDDGTFEADRVRFGRNVPGNDVRAQGRRMRVRITNSIFDRTPLMISNFDTAPERSEFQVSFSTFVFDTIVQECKNPNSYSRTAVFDNNIFFSSSAQVQRVIDGNACALVGNLTYPQVPALGGTNLDRDPRFVSLEAKDYRLQPGSPAVDAAVPSSDPGLDHDFAGTSRPQGVRKDIGAFELAP